jgi:hypothetical protein
LRNKELISNTRDVVNFFCVLDLIIVDCEVEHLDPQRLKIVIATEPVMRNGGAVVDEVADLDLSYSVPLDQRKVMR